MDIKKWLSRNKVILGGCLFGLILSSILLYLTLLNQDIKSPSGIELVIAIPSVTIFILLRFFFTFLGIDIGSMENPKHFTVILTYILIIFLYTLMGGLIGLLIQKVNKIRKKWSS